MKKIKNLFLILLMILSIQFNLINCFSLPKKNIPYLILIISHIAGPIFSHLRLNNAKREKKDLEFIGYLYSLNLMAQGLSLAYILYQIDSKLQKSL